ncbi:hypothetical protein GCM10027066_17540 [Dyella jejuensis]
MHKIITNSSATAELARRAGIEVSRISIVHPGVQLPESDYDRATTEAFRREKGFGDRTILLSVGRLSERKGIAEFVARALPSIIQQRSDVLLLVAGDTPRNALNARVQAPQDILALAEQKGLSEHIRLLGAVSDRELQLLFKISRVHVFPIRDIPGDPEGFGMVAVEAAAHGVPTIAFATGGVVDAVSEGVSGRLIQSGDYVGIARAVLEVISGRKQDTFACLEFARQFVWPRFGERLTNELFGL